MSELLNNTDNILCNFPPCLRKTIEELCRSLVGFLPINLEDISINSSRYSIEEEDMNNFHFIFKVPYAGRRLKWEVIFDPEDYYFAPDFDFNDDEFLSYPNIDTLVDSVPSWNNWNLKNPKSLSQVLNEFLNLYKQHQIQKLQMENIYSHYFKEFKNLINEKEGIASEDVEVNVDGNSIQFLINIPVDCSSLPEYIQPMLYKGNNLSEHTLYNHGADFAHLKISIPKLDGSRSSYSIQLSPRLQQAIGAYKFGFANLKKDTTLLEVVTMVSKSLESRLQQVVDHYKIKKIYIMYLVARCSKNIIEYDVTFKKAVFLFKIEDYNCMVTVTIGPKFPSEKPNVMLSSMYCPEPKTCTQAVDKYPYNSSFKPEINVDNLLEQLHDVVEVFRDHKH